MTPSSSTDRSSDWRQELPTLVGSRMTLRELRLTDAPVLLATMTTDDVARFISTPPASVEGFERFVLWTQHERAAGRYACFAVVPHDADHLVGIFQLRQVEDGFSIGEWGFALARECWGQGLFEDAARLVIEFSFEQVGIRRLEARSAVANGRGNAALRKIGAVHEGVLRRAFRKDGRRLDQSLWSILVDEWRATQTAASAVVVH